MRDKTHSKCVYLKRIVSDVSIDSLNHKAVIKSITFDYLLSTKGISCSLFKKICTEKNLEMSINPIEKTEFSIRLISVERKTQSYAVRNFFSHLFCYPEKMLSKMSQALRLAVFTPKYYHRALEIVVLILHSHSFGAATGLGILKFCLASCKE